MHNLILSSIECDFINRLICLKMFVDNQVSVSYCCILIYLLIFMYLQVYIVSGLSFLQLFCMVAI